jgi:fructokinase
MSESASEPRPLIVGEVLFDCFPGGVNKLGGAPFNVAWHLRALGLDPLLLSAVGNDEAGDAVLEAMSSWGLDTSGVGRAEGLPTGRVNVELDGGTPTYTIESASAWDAIGLMGCLEGAREGAFSLLYHGSLALRDERTRSTVVALRKALAGRILVDLNLREGWWTPEIVDTALSGTSLLKINDAELDALDVQDGATLRAAVAARAARVGERRAIHEIVVTQGAEGVSALFMSASLSLPASPLPGTRADTVGAGDAFTAILILGRDKGWPDDVTLRRASDFAARVCTIEGAVSRDTAFYETLEQEWKRDDDAS